MLHLSPDGMLQDQWLKSALLAARLALWLVCRCRGLTGDLISRPLVLKQQLPKSAHQALRLRSASVSEPLLFSGTLCNTTRLASGKHLKPWPVLCCQSCSTSCLCAHLLLLAGCRSDSCLYRLLSAVS